MSCGTTAGLEYHCIDCAWYSSAEQEKCLYNQFIHFSIAGRGYKIQEDLTISYYKCSLVEVQEIETQDLPNEDNEAKV